MRKYLIIFTALLLWFAYTSQAWAVTNLSIRIENPKSPSNQTGYNINFVALDNLGRVVSVDCLVQKPGEGSFNNFASGVVLPAGGGTGNCSTAGVFNQAGSYNFKVVAHAGADTLEDTATVDYNFGGPDTPTDYRKDKSSSCQYKINFHTANDSGRTVKVEIYRSENLSFTADSGTRVGEVGIGSNADGSFTDSIPDCNKTYYYAIRAFDNAGNGSGVIGDSQTTIITASPSPVSGAIPVGGTGGNILGEQASPTPTSSGQPTEEQPGEVKGIETNPEQPSLLSQLGNNKGLLAGILVLLIVLVAYLWRRSQSKA